MNVERTRDNDPAEDRLLAEILQPLDADAAAIDREAINRANAQAGELMESTTSNVVVASSRREASNSADRAGNRRAANRRFGLAPTLAAMAVLAVAVLLFFNQGKPASGDETLGQVIDRTLESDSLTLKVALKGETADVWVKPEGEVRWQESETKYVIAKGSRLWRVDETENAAQGEESSWYRAETKRVDLLSLIGMADGTSKSLRAAKPQETTQHAGRACRVYRVPFQDGDRKLTIEAFADARTGELMTIAAWPRDRLERTGPPLAELTLVARNEPLDESKFIVAKWLSADGRIGRIADSQGIVTVKPVMHDRWTPITGSMLLRPGDWVRTDIRGANAVALQMSAGAKLTLGPGSLIELLGPHQARMIHGEVQVEAEADSKFVLLSPDDEPRPAAEKELLRVKEGGFLVLKHTPVWLAGFEGTQSNESLGSLIANVNGQNVPLSVGYHKVTVEIRDQIARTTIEESFINHTDSRTEGVFYFPLPQDASISNFGMWIGNELVEADVVEKQRAREIYETIRRENRDPGLLEWSGGNIFKASVFPIFAHSEKRVKITYTQVLPVRGGRYRYSYGLRSEMLKQKPLRELSIDLKVSSALPIKEITCPTHAARTDKTEHAGHVEFTAQEYTPDRDFEVVVDIDGRQSDVVVVPHRRGDDGYFLLQLTPPAPAGNWQRELLPEGRPLELLIVADTSASMDEENRKLQSQLIASLLSSLGPKDRFNVGATDVDCVWAFEESQAAGEKPIAQARAFVDDRISLGWTDLDAMVRSVLRKVGKRTHVVYVGDGIVTTGSADPMEFINRLERLVQGKQATFHAVTVGSSYEPVVMKAIASIGGGSLRQISGEQGPQAIALELLNEIAQPGLRDLNVQIRGVQVAKVYPERLPNIAAGSQQIIIGRYLPEGRDQTGEVVVTGMRGDEKVQYKARFELRDAERGNSFIPRLWARQHLDHLLGQGSSQEVRDDIIGLSEEYHLITPYTSLLVLESDADRERFNVKRRFQMRDGEKFFAEGRGNANFELKQKQMKLAGQWRLALRRRILQQFATLGRDVSMINPMAYDGSGWARRSEIYSWSESGKDFFGSGTPFAFDVDGAQVFDLLSEISNETYGPFHEPAELEVNGEGLPRLALPESLTDYQFFERDLYSNTPLFDPLPGEPPSVNLLPGYDSFATNGVLVDGLRLLSNDRTTYGFTGGRGLALTRNFSGFESFRRPAPQQINWLEELYPYLPPEPKPDKDDPEESTWPDAAVALSKSLLRVEALHNMQGGLRLTSVTEGFNPRWDRVTSHTEALELYSPKSWLSRQLGGGRHTVVHWCDEKERGAFSKAFLLGRIRPSVKEDLLQIPFSLSDYSLAPLHERYPSMEPTIEQVGENRVRLVLTSKDQGNSHILLIDTARHVVLEMEWRDDSGRTWQKNTFGDFVEVAGRHWARQMESSDEEGRRTARMEWKLEALANAQFTQAVSTELADRERVQFLPAQLPKLAAAREAVVNQRGTFAEQFVMALHYSRTQQWKRVEEHLAAMEKLAAEKPGIRWLRDLFLRDARRFEELRKRLLTEAAAIAAAPSTEDLHLATEVLALSQRFAEANEQLEVLDQLRPVFARQPEHVEALKNWQERRIALLESASRTDELIAARKQLAVDYPWDPYAHTNYAYVLVVNRGDYETSLAWLNDVAGQREKWTESEEETLRSAIANYLQQQGRYADLLKFLQEWIGFEPAGQTAYSYYLSALIWNDQVDEAEAVMSRWMNEPVNELTGGALEEVTGFPEPNDKRLPPAMLARLNAAVSLAMGQGHDHHTNRIDPKWLGPLSKVVLAFARSKPHRDVAMRIIQQGTFNGSDEAIAVRRLAVELLRREVERLDPPVLEQFLNWTLYGPVETEREMWVELARRLEEEWKNEQDVQRKYALGESIGRLLSTKLGTEAHLRFLRLQHEAASEKWRTYYATQLFTVLIQQPWQDGYEAEAFELLPKLSESRKPGERLAAILPHLYQLTDRMLEARYEASAQNIDPETKKNRIELQKKQQELRQAAREDYAARLKEQIARQDDPLKKWLRVELAYVDVRLERNLNEVAALCREALGDAPPVAAEVDPQNLTLEYFNAVLRHRYMMTAFYLATLKATHEEMAGFMLKYIDAGIAQKLGEEPDDNDEEQSAQEAHNLTWKMARYQMLIALDRPEELEQDLRKWITEDRRTAPWRLSLGRLLAEQGRIEEAVRLYETVEHDDELTPEEYNALSDWYMVLDRREKHAEARLAYYKTMNEYHVHNLIAAHRRLHQRDDGTAPAQLDPEVLMMIRALFEKSTYPQNQLWEAGQLYAATRDFRLLESLPYAVIGQTASKIYGFLGSVDAVTSQVQEEATIDSLVERLAEVRKDAKSDVDRRALDLLVMMAERRAAEVQNQPGPHTNAALAAMRRAFDDHAWAEGEQPLLASLLTNLGFISQKPLAAEQLRQLRQLHAWAKPGSHERLRIAAGLAGRLWDYEHREEALTLFAAAITEFDDANGRKWPQFANDLLEEYIGFIESAGRYARAESVLQDHLRRPANSSQADWFEQRLNTVYQRALAADGLVSLGEGAVLYRNLEQRLFGQLDGAKDSQAMNVITSLSQMYRTANEKKYPTVSDDVRRFAFEKLPVLIGRLVDNYRSAVNNAAELVRDVLGPADGVLFLVGRMENEPARYRYRQDDAWSNHVNQLAEWRHSAQTLPPELEARLLKIVLDELRRDLITRQQTSRLLYSDTNSYFWRAKKADFAAAAAEVLAERNTTGESVTYIARYFSHDLKMHNRASEAMFAAHRANLLNDGQISTLVGILFKAKQWGQTIALLEPLVEKYPDNLSYRTQLMQAYFHSGRPMALETLLADTDMHFHQEERWTESVMHSLAQACYTTALYEDSAKYFGEAIVVHQNSQPGRGIGNGTLSEYFRQQAEVYEKLNKTKEAVDAAAGAIVSWGSNQDERGKALNTLTSILKQAADRDEYAAFLDTEAERTQEERPVVRKALGRAYVELNQFDRAVAQLQIAVRVQPNDRETHELLIKCFEAQKDTEAVIVQLLALAQLDRRDEELYRKLGQTLARDTKQQERAYTAMVEMKPHEAESHAMLAEIRQAQNRWDEAIVEWQHAAEIRSLEPTYLLSAAEAQIRQKQWDAAGKTLDKLDEKSWPMRFGNVHDKTLQLRKQIPDGEK